MKTEYKYIHFVEMPGTRIRIWHCLTNRTRDFLGVVKRYPRWNQWCYFPAGGLNETVYSKDCLQDIIHFIEQQESLAL